MNTGAEETIPALARILAVHHGIDCTVLFGVDQNGEIQAGISNIPGLEALKKADGMVIFTRFLALPVEQMKHIDDYLNRAVPVVGLRTSTHGFNYKDDKPPILQISFSLHGRGLSRRIWTSGVVPKLGRTLRKKSSAKHKN